jgi:hypothetical protein
MQNARYYRPILTKTGTFGQSLVLRQGVKFCENFFSPFRVVTCDNGTSIYTHTAKLKGVFRQLRCESAWNERDEKKRRN